MACGLVGGVLVVQSTYQQNWLAAGWLFSGESAYTSINRDFVPIFYHLST